MALWPSRICNAYNNKREALHKEGPTLHVYEYTYPAVIQPIPLSATKSNKDNYPDILT